MASISSVARPYARALFELGLEQKQLDSFKEQLAFLSKIMANQSVARLMSHPFFEAEARLDLLKQLTKDQLTDEMQAFLKVLNDHKRILLIPQILELFKEMVARQKRLSEVEIIAARAPSASILEELKKALARRLNVDINLQVSVDEKLLGGAVIRAGDKVIDGSLRGQLHRLKTAMLQI